MIEYRKLSDLGDEKNWSGHNVRHGKVQTLAEYADIYRIKHPELNGSMPVRFPDGKPLPKDAKAWAALNRGAEPHQYFQRLHRKTTDSPER